VAVVRRGQRGADLNRDRGCVAFVQRAMAEPVLERIAFDVLHHEKPDAVDRLDGVDGGDVRVIQGAERFGFPLKSREAVRIGRDLRRQDLDRDVALQPGVMSAIHLTHASRANGLDNLVPPEMCPCG